jgi:hypothetical protein
VTWHSLSQPHLSSLGGMAVTGTRLYSTDYTAMQFFDPHSLASLGSAPVPMGLGEQSFHGSAIFVSPNDRRCILFTTDPMGRSGRLQSFDGPNWINPKGLDGISTAAIGVTSAPNGRQLFVVTQKGLIIAEADPDPSTVVLRDTLAFEPQLNPIALSPDGRHLVIAAKKSTLVPCVQAYL